MMVDLEIFNKLFRNPPNTGGFSYSHFSLTSCISTHILTHMEAAHPEIIAFIPEVVKTLRDRSLH